MEAMRTEAVRISKVFTLIILVLAMGLEPTKQEGRTQGARELRRTEQWNVGRSRFQPPNHDRDDLEEITPMVGN
jgi:hypothetical protein